MSARGRGRYGVDAPGALTGLGLGAIGSLVAAGVAVKIRQRILGLFLLISGLYSAASAASFGYTTLRGKFAVWAQVLDQLGLTGNELALDLGCGRGAVLTMVARMLPRGRVTGVDLWRAQDQSGNVPRATRQNAQAEGVADRTDLVTADIRELPFAAASFDVVVSSLAVHNINDPNGRIWAVSEAFRVLRPGGRLLIADFRHTDEYADTLRRLGALEVAVHDLGWRYWYGAPWFATRMVAARK